MKKEMTQVQRNNKIRAEYIQNLIDLYENQGETVLQTKSNIIAIPTLDDDDNEIWIEIRVSIPRGSKGEEYDGYMQAYEFAEKEEERLLKEKEKEEKKKKQMEQNKKRKENEKDLQENIDYKKEWQNKVQNIKDEQGLD